MKSNDAVLVALLVVLVLIVAYQGSSWMRGGGCDAFSAGPSNNPYAALNKQLDAARGSRVDGYNQPRSLDARARDQSGQSSFGGRSGPEAVAEAERELWNAALEADNAGSFNSEVAQDVSADTMQYHSAAPPGDYDSYITDLVVDPRTRDNHRKWVEEMKPWSGTAMTVDDLDLEPTVDFIGLRRPQAVAQYNPLQLTEIDSGDLISNPRFNFRG
jgi:hypothetical protein